MTGIQIYYSVIVFIFGTVLGSFLNVLIYRLPIGMNFAKGSSICPQCRHELKWYDLFPLFSYIFLGGKCRYCKCKISAQYPIVESLNAIFYTLAFIFLYDASFKPELIGYCIIFSCLIVVFFTDFISNIIPDSMWIGILLGGIEIYVCDIIRNGFDKDVLIDRVIGFFSVSLVLFILGIIFEKIKGVDAIGGGDIKLMAAAGFVLGWKSIILATLVGTFIGLVYTVISTVVFYKKKAIASAEQKEAEKEERRKANKTSKNSKIAEKVRAQREAEAAMKKENTEEESEERQGKEIPFGPHLAVGIALAIFFGEKIVMWYADFVVSNL